MRHFILIPVETASSGSGCLGPLFVLLIIFIALTNNSQSQQGQVETREGSEEYRDPEYERELEEFVEKKERLLNQRKNMVKKVVPYPDKYLQLTEGDNRLPKSWNNVFIVTSFLGNKDLARMGQKLLINNTYEVTAAGASCIEVKPKWVTNDYINITFINPSSIHKYQYNKEEKGWTHAKAPFLASKCPL